MSNLKGSNDGYIKSYISIKCGNFVISSGIFPVRFLPDKTLLTNNSSEYLQQ